MEAEAEGGAVSSLYPHCIPTVSSLYPHCIPPKRGVCGGKEGGGGGKMRRRRKEEEGRIGKRKNEEEEEENVLEHIFHLNKFSKCHTSICGYVQCVNDLMS